MKGECVIRISVEICRGETRFRAAVWAESIERALSLARRRYPRGEARVLFPIEPDAFFVNEVVPPRELIRPEALDEMVR